MWDCPEEDRELWYMHFSVIYCHLILVNRRLSPSWLLSLSASIPCTLSKWSQSSAKEFRHFVISWATNPCCRQDSGLTQCTYLVKGGCSVLHCASFATCACWLLSQAICASHSTQPVLYRSVELSWL